MKLQLAQGDTKLPCYYQDKSNNAREKGDERLDHLPARECGLIKVSKSPSNPYYN
jgi:hypothetical protein